ncbi:hypothetical protein [Acrocarpospora macrocephala]|uniref:hypothetical protein n=1 Tax=Acrocarpospora macrocephala TaxID=150177 RepID=UPI0012D2A178|nr:hypothetical protein [Acrocarpospora macrocephala]
MLVPAVMRLAGRANWWAPAPLRRLHRRIDPHASIPPSTGKDLRRQRTSSTVG